MGRDYVMGNSVFFPPENLQNLYNLIVHKRAWNNYTKMAFLFKGGSLSKTWKQYVGLLHSEINYTVLLRFVKWWRLRHLGKIWHDSRPQGFRTSGNRMRDCCPLEAWPSAQCCAIQFQCCLLCHWWSLPRHRNDWWSSSRIHLLSVRLHVWGRRLRKMGRWLGFSTFPPQLPKGLVEYKAASGMVFIEI